jgi:hypothetical protein
MSKCSSASPRDLTWCMEKSSVIRVSHLLSLLASSSVACQVYDPSLAAGDRTTSLASQSSAAHGDAGSLNADDVDAGLEEAPRPAAAAHCGNGVVDADERCDITIANGSPGACPDGCSGRDGCMQRVLVGRDCDARCDEIQIKLAIPDDGCCPEGASPDLDNDCVAVCGNGVREGSERCDPPGTCVSQENCVSDDACRPAHYTGDAAHCTASCTVRPIEACVDGDGCCPAGCTSEHDKDCPTPPEASDCQTAHSGDRCEACECERCGDQARRCADSMAGGATACDAVAGCAAKNHCSGLDCYCGGGPIDPDRCQRWPLGPCVPELRAAAGSGNVFEMMLLGALDAGPIGHAVALFNCRRASCASECGLQGAK